jgi:hypothetical protein
MQGKLIESPANNYFEPVADTSHTAWKETLRKLEDSQNKWMEFLKELKPDDYSKVYSQNKMTGYEHFHGILQHDAYHLGQIVMLAKHA